MTESTFSPIYSISILFLASIALLFAPGSASAQHGGGHGGGGGGFHGGGGGGFHGGGGFQGGGGFSGGGFHSAGGVVSAGGSPGGFHGAASVPGASGGYAAAGGYRAVPSAPAYQNRLAGGAGGNSFYRAGGAPGYTGGNRAGSTATGEVRADGQWHSFAPRAGTGNSGTSTAVNSVANSVANSGVNRNVNGTVNAGAGANRESIGSSVRTFNGQGHEIWESTPSRGAVIASNTRIAGGVPRAFTSASFLGRGGFGVGGYPLGAHQFGFGIRGRGFGPFWPYRFGFGFLPPWYGYGFGWPGYGFGFSSSNCGWGPSWWGAGFGYDPLWYGATPCYGPWGTDSFNGYQPNPGPGPYNQFYVAPNNYPDDYYPAGPDDGDAPNGDAGDNQVPNAAVAPDIPANTTSAVQLYLKSGGVFSAINYWVAGDRLHYVAENGAVITIDLNQLDLERTVNENAKRGLHFELQTQPNSGLDPAPAVVPAAPVAPLAAPPASDQTTDPAAPQPI